MNKYGYWQIKHILESQGLRMELVPRYKQRTSRYNIYDADDNLIEREVTLNFIRCRFTKLGYPIDYYP